MNTTAVKIVLPPAYPVMMGYAGAPNGVFIECLSETCWHDLFVECRVWLSSHPGARAQITTISPEKYWCVSLIVQDKKLICSPVKEPTADEWADYLSGYDTDGECYCGLACCPYC